MKAEGTKKDTLRIQKNYVLISMIV
jgi:hypothetical protein